MTMNTMCKYINLAIGLVLLLGCSSHDEALVSIDDEAQIIHIGDVSVNDMQVTASTRAATTVAPEWLKSALRDEHMDVYYYTKSSDQHSILKLEDSGYTLKTNDGNAACRWLGNGVHTFQGVYVPEGLKTLKVNQDYTDLCRFTAIPPKKEIYATIDKITIPLKHRLARVQAYVLIDNSIKNINGEKTKLKGYEAGTNHDGEKTMFRFCNVRTLSYVDIEGGGHPIWKKENKAIPHYLGELGSIVEDNKVACETFRTYKKSSGELLFPTDPEWKVAHEAYKTNGESCGYEMTDYGKVPSYDIIVEPTYTHADSVLYDEADKTALAAKEFKNQIDFELTLDNGLEYEKEFVFDLNANDETVVFLRVTPEKIDYNSTGSRLWKSETYGDDYYGVNNADHELSEVGSSWQRAYTLGNYTHSVTDGNEYKDQYISDDEVFIALLKEAKEKGNNQGRYFILQKDITINLKDFPDYLVGHLDAMGHTITVVPDGDRNWLYVGLESGWNSEILNAKIEGGVLFDPQTSTINGHVKNCWNNMTPVDDVTPALLKIKSENED